MSDKTFVDTDVLINAHEDESQIGFWDALIVSAAAASRAARILSEDLNAGQRIAGILIENPFIGVH